MASVSRSWLRAIGLGLVTGSRSALGPALVARQARRGWLQKAAYVMAAMELIADKLPWVPSRAAAVGLAPRIISGAGVARALLRRRRRGSGRVAAGAVLALGAAAAIAGAFTGLRLRLALTKRLGGGALANAVAGAIEDAALIGIGRRLV